MNDDGFRQRVRILLKRRTAYRRLFLADDGSLSEDAKVVLGDLARFCNAMKPSTRLGPQGVDAGATLVGEGRREVWLRLQNMLHIDDRTTVDLPRHAETE